MAPSDFQSLPLDRLHLALSRGRTALEQFGLPLEPATVGVAVEQHRWAWKPDTVRVILIAESHVYTSHEDSVLRTRPEALPPEARHAPTDYVRLVYCLGYGESTVLTAPPVNRNGGTPQFWNIFGRLAGTGRLPTTVAATWRERIRWKVDTLTALKERGVWLVDASLHGIYAPGAVRVPTDVTTELHRIWWTDYGAWVLGQSATAYRCVIGRGVAGVLTELGVPFHNWLYQPQARAVPGVDLEHGWPELLDAAGR